MMRDEKSLAALVVDFELDSVGKFRLKRRGKVLRRVEEAAAPTNVFFLRHVRSGPRAPKNELGWLHVTLSCRLKAPARRASSYRSRNIRQPLIKRDRYSSKGNACGAVVGKRARSASPKRSTPDNRSLGVTPVSEIGVSSQSISSNSKHPPHDPGKSSRMVEITSVKVAIVS